MIDFIFVISQFNSNILKSSCRWWKRHPFLYFFIVGIPFQISSVSSIPHFTDLISIVTPICKGYCVSFVANFCIQSQGVDPLCSHCKRERRVQFIGYHHFYSSFVGVCEFMNLQMYVRRVFLCSFIEASPLCVFFTINWNRPDSSDIYVPYNCYRLYIINV